MATALKTTPKVAQAHARAAKLLTRYAAAGAELDRLKTERKPLEEEYSSLRQELQAYAEDVSNAADFNEKQLLALDAGSFGFRQGPERLGWSLDAAPAEPARTAAVVAAIRKLLPTAVKESYDEKLVLKAWGIVPKLTEKLTEIGLTGPVRERQFLITLKK